VGGRGNGATGMPTYTQTRPPYVAHSYLKTHIQGKGKEGDTSSSAAHAPLGARPGGTPRLRSVAASRDAIQLIRTQIIGRCCCIIPPSELPSRAHFFVSLCLLRPVPYTHTHTQPAPRPRHTVSRYVLCLILVGNTDHIIVIVQSCAGAGGAKKMMVWLGGRYTLTAAGWRCPEACWTPSVVGPER